MTRFHTEPQYLIELEAHDGVTYGFATGRGFAPTDPDAALYRGQYDGRVSSEARLTVRRQTDGAGSSSGAAGQDFGAIILDNSDGALDALGEKGFDGRALRILFAPAGAQAMTDCEPVYRGTVTELQVQRLKVTITLRDRLEELNTPIGSTVDAAEWPEADGERMPVVAGAAVSVPLFWLDRVLLIAAVHDGAATVSGVFDLGVALTAGSDYADMAELKSTAPASGQYRVLSTDSGTFVRLGSRPQDHDKMAADVVTADPDGPSQIQQLALRAPTFGGSRKNLILDNSDLASGNWSGTGVTATNVSDDDLGTVTRLVSTTSGFWRNAQARSVAPGQVYTLSFRAKEGSGSLHWRAYDVTNGVEIATGPYTIPADGRVVLSFTAPSGCTAVFVYPTYPRAASDVKIWDVQLEAGDEATLPVIPTAEAEVTVLNDFAYATFEPGNITTSLEAFSRQWGIGGWWPGEATVLDALSEIARSLGAVIFFDRLGKLSAARLTPEAAVGVIGIYGPQNRSPGGGARRATELDRLRLGKPAKEISVGYAKSHAVFSDLGALWDTAAARAERISRDYARSVVEGAGVASKHLLASSMRLDTILNDKTQAETVAEELRAAQGEWFHSVIIPADEAAFEALDLGVLVDIYESRWSGAAISTVVREIAHDLTAGTITLGVRE